jgi:hypothetical protein
MTVWVRDEYAPRFGRQALTIWTGQLADVYEGYALEMPKHNGYMLKLSFGPSVRVECESPRTDENYERVDEALAAAFKSVKA